VHVSSRAAKRYARAAFDLAAETGRMDALTNDLRAMKAVLDGSPDLQRFLRDYRLPHVRRVAILKDLFEEKLDPLTFRFALFLESKKRMALLGVICEEVSALHDRWNGTVRGTLTSAYPLETSDVAAICDRAVARGHGGLRLEQEVDGGLLGGFRLRVGALVYDLSIAGQLRRWKARLAVA
jgi:F-type H+-transporting ATPase subunit delta